MNPNKKEKLDKTPPFDANTIVPDNYPGFLKARAKSPMTDVVQMNMPEGFVVDTPEGRVRGQQGDWLFIFKGERRVVSNEDFQANYQLLSEKTSR